MPLQNLELYSLQNSTSLNQQIHFDLFGTQVEVFIKREDLLHPFVSGNKFRKLKYNLLAAKEANHHTLLTFGGAFSNHIAATAFAAKAFSFRAIDMIRGKELIWEKRKNPTLDFTQEHGM